MLSLTMFAGVAGCGLVGSNIFCCCNSNLGCFIATVKSLDYFNASSDPWVDRAITNEMDTMENIFCFTKIDVINKIIREKK